MYSLEYKMMLQVLLQFHYSGEVHAQLDPRPSLKRGEQVVLIVQNGTVTSCFILDKQGQKVFQDSSAQNVLLKIGVLEWKLLSSPASPTSKREATLPNASLPSRYSSDYPRRRFVTPSQLSSWSPLHRSVYSLADGMHQSEHIAALLSRPVDAIRLVIRDLQEKGALE